MILSFLLQAPAGGGGYTSLIFILLLFGVLYLFMIRPQVRKQKEAAKYRESVQKGDKIVTIGGIHGTIVEVADTSILVEVDEGVKLRFEKNAVNPEATIALNKKGEEKKKS